MNTNVHHLAFTLFILLFSTVIYSQETKTNDLLWEITGNGLTEPSYLFGTMHVKDPRAFNFADEVMLSIEKCDAFALEVQPDSIIKSMFAKSFEEEKTDTTDYIKELLSEEEYKKLNAVFEEKTGYGMDQLESKNPVILKRLLTPDLAGEDDKQTFVDAYLFGIARTLRKDIMGLEDAETQMDLLDLSTPEEQRAMFMDFIDYSPEDYENFYDDFVAVYATGDLNLIYKTMGKKEIYDLVMMQRNKVMAKSMIEIMHEKSLFAAMGVAHLLGDTSVIALLQYEGYTVKPVKPSFTGVADQYTIDPAKMEWASYKNEDAGFEVEFPGIAIDMDIIESMTSVIHPDMTTESYYMAYALDLRNRGITEDKKTLLERMLQSVGDSRTHKVVKKKWLTDKGRECLDGTLKGKSQKSGRVRFFWENDIVYAVYVETDLNQLKESYIKRVFESFTISEPAPLPEKSTEWKRFTDTLGAFSIMLPGEPEKITRSVPNPNEPEGDNFEIILYLLTDAATMTNYLIAYNDFPNKYFLEDVYESYNNAFEDLKGKGEILSPLDTIELAGRNARRTTLLVQGKSYSECRYLFRGNRYYRVLKQNLKFNEMELNEDQFFESFKLEPYEASAFVPLEPEGQDFSMEVFKNQILEVDTSVDHSSFIGDVFHYYFKDMSSGNLYSLEVSELKKYFKINHLDSFYNTFEEGVLSYRDTILNKKSVLIDGVSSRDLLIKDTVKGNISRNMYFIDRDYMYFLYCYGAEEELFGETPNRYFNSFKKRAKTSKLDIYASKAQLILENLLSTDTLEQAMAYGALGYYEFEEEDISLLQQALAATYSDDTSSLDTRKSLILALSTFEEESAVEFLKSEYRKPNQKSEVKEEILDGFNDPSDPKKLEVFLELFLNDPPTEPVYAGSLFYPFRDSLELFAQHYKQLLPLIEKEDYRSNILTLATQMANKDTLNYKATVANSFDQLTEYAIADLENFKNELAEDPDRWFYCGTCNNYLFLMQSIKNQSLTDSYTNKYITIFQKNYNETKGVFTRIVNGLPVHKKIVKSQLANTESRLEIIKAYKEIDNLSAVPAKYLEEEAIAKILLIELFSYDYGEPDKMQLLGTLNTEKGKVYAYELKYEHYEKKGEYYSYRGIVAYFNNQVSNFEIEEIETYTDWEEDEATDWQTHVKKMMEELE